jgi:FKBP-type peptidyl-prolyl cis-trans isomerase
MTIMFFKNLSLISLILIAGAYMTTKDAQGKTTSALTQGGVRYEITEKSDGKTARAGQKVHVHYTGWLNEGGNKGKKFDSSLDRGKAFSFTLGAGQVIQGWDEGVSGMQVGEKRTLFIPATLGYGAHGAGDVIPPNADLIFDVELIDVEDAS